LQKREELGVTKLERSGMRRFAARMGAKKNFVSCGTGRKRQRMDGGKEGVVWGGGLGWFWVVGGVFVLGSPKKIVGGVKGWAGMVVERKGHGSSSKGEGENSGTKKERK